MIVFVLVVLTGFIMSCQKDKEQQTATNDIYENIIVGVKSSLTNSEFIDSLYEAGGLSEMGRDYFQGYVQMYKLANYDSAVVIYQKILDIDTKNRQDRLFQILAASDIVIMRDYQGFTESMMMTAMETMKRFSLEEASADQAVAGSYLRMQANLGNGFNLLGDYDEAEKNFEACYQAGNLITERVKSLSQWLQFRLQAMDIIIRSEMGRGLTEKTLKWVERDEKLMAQYDSMPDANRYNLDAMRGTLLISKARALQLLGREQEASEAFEAYLQTDISHSPIGLMNSADYLIPAHRYEEAAKGLESLDVVAAQFGMDMSLDVIQSFYLAKFESNDKAGRRDSAYAVSKKICLALDSAIVHYKRNKSAELAAIYQTQQKEQMIMEQHAELMQQRVVGLLIAIALLIIFFVAYILLRRQSQRRLAAANQQLEESNRQLQTMNLELQEANDRAEESSRMKTNFIKQISHEIRTPLNILGGFTQVVTTSGMELDEATRLDINHQILDNTNRITGLVNKMLELSDVNSHTVIERSDETTAERIALQAVGDSGVGNTQQVVFTMQIDEDVKEKLLRTNENQAVRALSLLLDNASKYTKEGSILLKVTLKGNHDVAFIVEDTGIGVPASEAEHIFEEFVQLDDYCEGTGIGLTVARSIVQRLGGNIVLDTTYHDGARFVMTLPL